MEKKKGEKKQVIVEELLSEYKDLLGEKGDESVAREGNVHEADRAAGIPEAR